MSAEKRRIAYGIILVAVFIVGFALGWYVKPVPTGVKPPDKVVFGLSWIPLGYHAFTYVALDKGFWADENIQAEIIRGYGSSEVLKALRSGGIHISEFDSSTLVLARSQGINVKATFMWRDTSVFGLWYVKEFHPEIKGPKDLEGLSIATVAGGSDTATFPAFLALNGVDMNKIKMVYVTEAVKFPMVMEKKADAFLGYLTSALPYKFAAKDKGYDLECMLWADFGFEAYGQTVGVSDELIKQNPDLVARLMRGLYKGLYYTIKYPDSAFQIMLKYQPQVNTTADRATIDIDNTLRTPIENAEKYGYGYMVQDRWTWTRDLMVKYMNLTVVPEVSDLYTNEFIPKDFKDLENSVATMKPASAAAIYGSAPRWSSTWLTTYSKPLEKPLSGEAFL